MFFFFFFTNMKHFVQFFLNISLSISQSNIVIYIMIIQHYIWALYDDRTLVIRITMYECIFVMLTELRTGGGA